MCLAYHRQRHVPIRIARVFNSYGPPGTPPAAGRRSAPRKPDITLVQRKLGWRPRIDLDEGLAMTIDWFCRVLEVPVLRVFGGMRSARAAS